MKTKLMTNYGLNESQAQVVLDDSKELIVPAGAGSGKTKTLVTKVVHLINEGKDLESFLVLTFTKKAANEMKARIKSELKGTPLFNKIDSSDISTFDSFAYNFVKQNATLINLDPNIELLDPVIFNLQKTEILQNIIYEIMADENHPLYEFIINYTDKNDEKELINDLKNLYEKLINIKPLDEFFVDELIKDIKLFDVETDELIIREVNEEFYFENEETLNFLFANAKTINKESFDNPFEKSKFNWKMVTDEEKKIISKITDQYNKAYNEGITSDDIDEIIDDLKEDAKNIFTILNKYNLELEAFKSLYNKYEFRDIANFLNLILKENEDALKKAKDKYKYVFVDEYQDTSKVQSDFLEMLIKDNDEIKVLYVGDIKQSIYKFRDAKPETFIEKLNNVKNIPLMINYRSAPNVIKFVNDIFERILDDKDLYDIDYNDNHQMDSGTTLFKKEDKEADVFLLEYIESDVENRKLDVVEEAFLVGYKIKELIDKGIVNKYNEIAILSRNKSTFKHYRDVFKYLNIPLEIHVDFSVKETYLLKLIANILSLSYSLYDINSFNQNRFNYLSLVRSELYSKNDYEIFASLMDQKEVGKKRLEIDKDIKESLIKINKVINTKSNVEVIKEVIDEFDIFRKIIYAPNSFEKELQLDYLFNLSKVLSDLNIVNKDFIDYLYNLAYDDEINLSIPILQDESVNSVILTNIHQSKGLEYNTLFMVDLDRGFNKGIVKKFKYTTESKLLIRKPYEGAKDFVVKKNLRNAQKIDMSDDLKEELRLLYVSMTRAEKALYIVSKDVGEGVELNSFNDYLYNNNFKDFIKVENIETIDRQIKDFDYYKNRRDKNLFYPSEIDELEEHVFSFKSKTYSSNKASLDVNEILSDTMKQNLKQGTKLHESFEYGNTIIDVLSKHQLSNKNILDGIIYREHNYSYLDDKVTKAGVIDLLVVYDDEVHIIDFKTKNIDKLKYNQQLISYKEYASKVFLNKYIKLYLYSIVEDRFEEITDISY